MAGFVLAVLEVCITFQEGLILIVSTFLRKMSFKDFRQVKIDMLTHKMSIPDNTHTDTYK
jgi:hypothetical protein